MQKRILVITPLWLTLAMPGAAQQYPVFTQYYFNELVINPAYAGNHIQLSATSQYRNQWVNFDGAPKTFSFSAHTALMKSKIGVGMLVNVDKIGSYSNKNVYFSYAYYLKLKKSMLSMGLQAGFDFIGADFSKLDLQNPGDLSFIPINAFKPNVGAGLYYSKKNWFLGFSVPLLINSNIQYSLANVVNEIKQARYYFLRGGIILPLTTNKNIKFNPSFLVRSQEQQALSFDFNAAFIFYDVFSTGVSYRTVDALITFVEIKLSDRFHVAYSYDWTRSSINLFSNGTHEFMLNYRTRIRGVHKNVECPSFYDYR